MLICLTEKRLQGVPPFSIQVPLDSANAQLATVDYVAHTTPLLNQLNGVKPRPFYKEHERRGKEYEAIVSRHRTVIANKGTLTRITAAPTRLYSGIVKRGQA
jgi:hypothetical protein